MKTENNLAITITNSTHTFTLSDISIYFKTLKLFLQKRWALNPN
jgi:hypothetical protein